jgi:hypothetical protein
MFEAAFDAQENDLARYQTLLRARPLPSPRDHFPPLETIVITRVMNTLPGGMCSGAHSLVVVTVFLEFPVTRVLLPATGDERVRARAFS